MTLIALDVHYDDRRGLAWAAAAKLHAWDADEADAEAVVVVPSPHAYVPGEFYRRELPCLEAVLRELTADVLVVDGYVDLGPGRPGLGRVLSQVSGRPVVGVAKTRFEGAEAVPVLRGSSAKPLWVTATDDVAAAARAVASMHGDDRIPTMLRRVDRLARDAAADLKGDKSVLAAAFQWLDVRFGPAPWAPPGRIAIDLQADFARLHALRGKDLTLTAGGLVQVEDPPLDARDVRDGFVAYFSIRRPDAPIDITVATTVGDIRLVFVGRGIDPNASAVVRLERAS